MYSKTLLHALPFLAAILTSTVVAQTWTSCNPLNSTDCPTDIALGISNYSIDFTTEIMTTKVWNATNGVVYYGDNGAQFTISQKDESPTVQTNFYLFFGQVEVIARAAPGQGIISSMVLESNDLDEIDWEFMGGNDSFVETNYFGKGNTTDSSTRAFYYPVSQATELFHNYTLDWSQEKLDWIIDGNVVRTLLYEDANGGQAYPQTPMQLKLGNWAGGDASEPNGTIEWAGGLTDYSQGPFTMTVKSVRVSDASRGTEYKYGDTSGTFQSIQMLNTTKPLKLDGNNDPSASQTMKQKWNALSPTTKIAVGASIGGALLIAMLVFAFFCVKQRSAGRRERAIEDAAFEKNAADVMAYRAAMVQQKTPLVGVRENVRESWNRFGGQKGFQRF